jgi:hypothetical protein
MVHGHNGMLLILKKNENLSFATNWMELENYFKWNKLAGEKQILQKIQKLRNKVDLNVEQWWEIGKGWRWTKGAELDPCMCCIITLSLIIMYN